MIFPGSDEPQEAPNPEGQAPEPAPAPVAEVQAQPDVTPSDAAPAADPQADVPAPDPVAQRFADVEARNQALQQQVQALAAIAMQQGYTPQQVQQPAPVPDALTPEKYWEDPITASRRVATEEIQRVMQTAVLPHLQQQAVHEKNRSDQAIAQQLEQLKSDPKTKAHYAKYESEVIGELSQVYQRYGPAFTAQPRVIRDTLAHVVGRHLINTQQEPEQPPLAQAIPAVGTKVSAPRSPNTKKVELTEDEAKEARKSRMSNEEYARYRDNIYG